jgi:type III pantothenate kinase
MTAHLVADVGNSRIKWGHFQLGGMRVAAVPPDDPVAWAAQLREWAVTGPAEWAIASVHPTRRDQLAEWLKAGGATVRIISDYRELPIRLDVASPEKVGIDRLLNAVAAAARVPPNTPAVIIDAGSAVTVDLVDAAGTFRGGAIFPGLRLMARALHQFTAQLPLVQDFELHDLTGRDTTAAIRAGVYYAVCGGVDRLVGQMVETGARIFLAGGSVEIAADLRCRPEVVGPALTLDGIRRTAWPET